MALTLREVRDEDLPLLFEQWADPVAVHMAAFTRPDHSGKMRMPPTATISTYSIAPTSTGYRAPRVWDLRARPLEA